MWSVGHNELTHRGWATHICVSKLTIIGSDNDLSPGRHQGIIWTNDWILLIRPLGTNLSEFSVEILIFSFKKMRLKVSSAKRRPFCLCLNELRPCFRVVSWGRIWGQHAGCVHSLSSGQFPCNISGEMNTGMESDIASNSGSTAEIKWAEMRQEVHPLRSLLFGLGSFKWVLCHYNSVSCYLKYIAFWYFEQQFSIKIFHEIIKHNDTFIHLIVFFFIISCMKILIIAVHNIRKNTRIYIYIF